MRLCLVICIALALVPQSYAGETIRLARQPKCGDAIGVPIARASSFKDLRDRRGKLLQELGSSEESRIVFCGKLRELASAQERSSGRAGPPRA